VYKAAELGYINLMRDRTTIPTNQPLNNLKIMKTALLLTAGLLVTGVGAAVLSTANAPAPAQRVITELAAGTATFQHATAETADTFTFTTQVGGISSVKVTFNDGVQVSYSPNSTDLNQIFVYTNGSKSEATIEWDGQTAIVTNGNNTTKLGGFKTAFNEVLSNRAGERQAEEAAQAARAELDNLSFDGMVSEISQKACVVLEGQQYISNSAVTQSINNVLGTYQMGPANEARWNNMNGQLRGEKVRGAMAWDCNDAMMVAAENGFNNAALGLGLLLNNY
jgi:hypothetical protein